MHNAGRLSEAREREEHNNWRRFEPRRGYIDPRVLVESAKSYPLPLSRDSVARQREILLGQKFSIRRAPDSILWETMRDGKRSLLKRNVGA